MGKLYRVPEWLKAFERHRHTLNKSRCAVQEGSAQIPWQFPTLDHSCLKPGHWGLWEGTGTSMAIGGERCTCMHVYVTKEQKALRNKGSVTDENKNIFPRDLATQGVNFVSTL